MSGPRRSLAAAACAGVAFACAAPFALADFGSSVDAGSLAVSSASLAAPTGVAAATGACTAFKARKLTVTVTWVATTSPEATGYVILRSSSSDAGPYTQVATVPGIGTTTWTDATGALSFSKPYWYVVQSTVAGWTSPPSATAPVTTPSFFCR